MRQLDQIPNSTPEFDGDIPESTQDHLQVIEGGKALEVEADISPIELKEKYVEGTLTEGEEVYLNMLLATLLPELRIAQMESAISPEQQADLAALQSIEESEKKRPITDEERERLKRLRIKQYNDGDESGPYDEYDRQELLSLERRLKENGES